MTIVISITLLFPKRNSQCICILARRPNALSTGNPCQQTRKSEEWFNSKQT